VDFTNLVGLSSVVEDTFGGGGFTGVNVGHDSDVAVQGEFDFAVGGGGGFVEVDVLGYSDVTEDDEGLLTVRRE
jgi:hypothetical protein